jgi:hypothetical protein
MITRRGLLGSLLTLFAPVSAGASLNESWERGDLGAVTFDDPIVLWGRAPSGKGYVVKMRDCQGVTTVRLVTKLDIPGWSDWCLCEKQKQAM